MASSTIAIEARPALVGVFVATVALAPWQHGPRVEHVRVSLEDVTRPPVVVPLGAGPSKGPISALVDALAPRHPDVVDPGPHPDAQPWPRGMVIHPPPFHDPIAIDMPTALDKVLSGLLAPWTAIAS